MDVHVSTTHWRRQASPPTSQISYYDPSVSARWASLVQERPARTRIPRPFPRRPCFPSHSLAPSNLISSFQPTTPCSAPESPLCDPLCSSKFPFVSSCPWEREREACWLNSASTAEPAPPGPPARQADWRSGRRCWRGLSPQLRERAAQTLAPSPRLRGLYHKSDGGKGAKSAVTVMVAYVSPGPGPGCPPAGCFERGA